MTTAPDLHDRKSNEWPGFVRASDSIRERGEDFAESSGDAEKQSEVD